MDEVGGSLIIKTDIDASGLERGSKQIEAAFRQAAGKVGEIGDKARTSVEKSINAFSKLNQAFEQQKQKVTELEQKLAEMSKTQVKTEAFASVEKEIDTLQRKIDALVDKEDRFRATGGNMDSRTFQQMEYDIERLGEALRAAQAEKERLMQSGGAYTDADVSGLSAQLTIEKEKLQQLNARLNVSYSETANKLNDYSEKAEKAGQATNNLGQASEKASSTGKTLGSSFDGIGKNLKSIFANTGGKLKSGLSQLLRYSLGIRSLYALFNRLRSAIKEGFSNLAQFDSGTNRSISQLQSALTQLKNATATAVAPLLNALAPALTTIINLFTRAANAVGYFIAAMTGQSSFIKATEVQQDYAASLGGTAAAADKAAKAVQNLSGLDELNTLQSDSGTGGGGGGGGGAGGAGSMFETVEIPNRFKDLAALIKESWENADFTSVGRLIGDKLKFALDSIPWDNVKSGAERVAKSLATLINGFVETPGLWQTVGNTIAQGFNTAVLSVNTFLDNTHFKSIGSAFSTTLQSTFQNVNWGDVGHTISSIISSGLDLATGILNGINWETFPNDIAAKMKAVIEGFDWSKTGISLLGLLKSLLRALPAIEEVSSWIIRPINSLTEFIFQRFFKGISDSINDAVNSGEFASKGKAIINGIFNGIVEWYSTIGSWIKEHIFNPFVDWFKSVFNIHSPAAAPEIVDLGKNLIEGVFNGAIEWMKNIKSWVSEHILHPFRNAVNGETLTNALSDVKDVGLNFTATLTGFKDKIKAKTKVVNEFAAGVSTIDDNVDDGDKEIDGINALITTMSDKLVKSAKNIAGIKAEVTSFADKIASSAKVVTGVKANATSFSDGISSGSKIINSVKANVTSIVDKVAAASKLITGVKANFTQVSSSLTAAQRTISVTANVTAASISSSASSAISSALSSIIRKLLGGKENGGIMVNGIWQSIQGYASGGSPRSARLFYANENGIPELIGRIGRSTAVLNNGQIVSSVASGVYQAVMAAFTQLRSSFVEISNNLALIPPAISSISFSNNLPVPAIASGTVAPAGIFGYANDYAKTEDVQALKTSVDNLASLVSRMQGNTYNITARANAKAIFDMTIQEGRADRVRYGRNPFDLT